MDWFGHRRNVRWTYKRVSWGTWEEIGDYDNIVGGSDEESYFTSLKGSGSLDYIGEAPSSVDMVRTYYEFVGDDGDPVRVAVCTHLVETAKELLNGGGAVTGTVSTYSVLKVADDRKPGLPLTVAAGENAVALAASLLEGLGLRVVASESKYELANYHTFKPDDSYLTIVNWLLSAAGFGSAYTDANGTVILSRYEGVSNREPVFRFDDGRKSIMFPEVEDENDYTDTPNVVRLFAEDEYGGYWAVAKNVDPDFPSSLYNRGGSDDPDRGREVTLYDEVTELKPEYDEDDDEATAESKARQRAEALLDMACEKLTDSTSIIEYVTISNGFYPLKQGDSVEITYGDRRWRGTVTNVKRDHTTESKCQTKVRRFVSYEPEMLKLSGVIGND